MATIGGLRKAFSCTDHSAISRLGSVLFLSPALILMVVYGLVCAVRLDNPFNDILLIRSLWFASMLLAFPALGFVAYPWSVKGSRNSVLIRSIFIGIIWFLIARLLLFGVWLGVIISIPGSSVSSLSIKPILNWLYFNRGSIPGLAALILLSFSFSFFHFFYSRRT